MFQCINVSKDDRYLITLLLHKISMNITLHYIKMFFL